MALLAVETGVVMKPYTRGDPMYQLCIFLGIAMFFYGVSGMRRKK